MTFSNIVVASKPGRLVLLWSCRAAPLNIPGIGGKELLGLCPCSRCFRFDWKESCFVVGGTRNNNLSGCEGTPLTCSSLCSCPSHIQTSREIESRQPRNKYMLRLAWNQREQAGHISNNSVLSGEGLPPNIQCKRRADQPECEPNELIADLSRTQQSTIVSTGFFVFIIKPHTVQYRSIDREY